MSFSVFVVFNKTSWEGSFLGCKRFLNPLFSSYVAFTFSDDLCDTESCGFCELMLLNARACVVVMS
jgi:hypothetical protein